MHYNESITRTIYKMIEATMQPRESPSLKEATSASENKQGHHSVPREVNEKNIDVVIEGASTAIMKASTAKPTKGTAKFRKDPSAPKRFNSSFILFYAKKHKEIRAQLGQGSSSARVSKMSSKRSLVWVVITCLTDLSTSPVRIYRAPIYRSLFRKLGNNFPPKRDPNGTHWHVMISPGITRKRHYTRGLG